MKKILKYHEFYVFLTILLVSVMIEAVSGQFYTANNLVDNIRSFIPTALFSIALMFSLISGGIDLSFPSVAALSGYVVITLQNSWGGEGSLLTGYLLVILLGMCLGVLNGILIGYFKFPPMIVTLATGNVYLGIMQGVLRCHEIMLPKNLLDFGKKSLFVVSNQELDIQASMPVTILLVGAVVLVSWFILQRTMLGRGIFAVGGDIQSAARAGFRVVGIQIFVYGFAGAVAGLTGYTRYIMNLYCVPTSLIGIENDVIACTVLGGVRMTGGVGTIKGALLGTLLLTIVKNSLLLLNVPSYWQTMVSAIFIILGTGITAVQMIVSRKKNTINRLGEQA